MGKLLEVNDLHTYFFLRRGIVKAVNGVTFSVDEGQTVGIVGESGSGKSITVYSILRMEPPPAAKIVKGSITFKNQDLVKLPQKEMQNIRGKEISMIMQDPMTALNPAYHVGDQVAESFYLHTDIRGYANIHREVISSFKNVMIPDPESRYYVYPHQLSGGMRQRVVGAVALACKPSLLIADEPTTALDVTIQGQYLEMIKRIQQEMGVAMIFITHDLGIVAKMCDYVCVMYLGKIMEQGNIRDIWHNPQHKYTEALLQSIPRIDKKAERLYSIPGHVPAAHEIPSGCSFHPRCPSADEQCRMHAPPVVQVSSNHQAYCWKAQVAK